MKKYVLIALVAIGVASCTVVKQDEVGVKRRLGKIDDTYITPGPAGYNLFTTRVIKVPTRTVNLELRPDLPSKEG
jgi:prohibitin 1